MELVSFVKELLHEAAEVAASYRVGQSALRYVDKALWTVEKSARWAVPPPLEQDERQPELIRPLPWVFFLMLLVALRVIRESISLINLALGKPPLRSADVVIFIQGKRRYLRTLKYQGSRMMRARSEPASWRSGIYSLFEFTMCFRNSHCPNNNSQSSGDELVMVSRNEPSMERLLEKMVQVEADTDDFGTAYKPVANTRSDAETTNESFEDSREEIVTSTPVKRDSTQGDRDACEQHVRNGPNPAPKIGSQEAKRCVDGRRLHFVGTTISQTSLITLVVSCAQYSGEPGLASRPRKARPSRLTSVPFNYLFTRIAFYETNIYFKLLED